MSDGLEDDRAEQFAGELHDGPVQWIVGAKMQAEAIRAHVRSGRPIPAGSLDMLIETLQCCLGETRRMMHGLLGPDLPDGLWHEALQADIASGQQWIASTQALTGTQPTSPVQVIWQLGSETEPLPEKLAQTSYRLLREAIWNALRHAAATQIRVSAQRASNQKLELVVEDDGRGFDLERLPPGRLGVKGLSDRATRAGGTIHVATQVGKGTRIEFNLPCD